LLTTLLCTLSMPIKPRSQKPTPFSVAPHLSDRANPRQHSFGHPSQTHTANEAYPIEILYAHLEYQAKVDRILRERQTHDQMPKMAPAIHSELSQLLPDTFTPPRQKSIKFSNDVPLEGADNSGLNRPVVSEDVQSLLKQGLEIYFQLEGTSTGIATFAVNRGIFAETLTVRAGSIKALDENQIKPLALTQLALGLTVYLSAHQHIELAEKITQTMDAVYETRMGWDRSLAGMRQMSRDDFERWGGEPLQLAKQSGQIVYLVGGNFEKSGKMTGTFNFLPTIPEIRENPVYCKIGLQWRDEQWVIASSSGYMNRQFSEAIKTALANEKNHIAPQNLKPADEPSQPATDNTGQELETAEARPQTQVVIEAIPDVPAAPTAIIIEPVTAINAVIPDDYAAATLEQVLLKAAEMYLANQPPGTSEIVIYGNLSGRQKTQLTHVGLTLLPRLKEGNISARSIKQLGLGLYYYLSNEVSPNSDTFSEASRLAQALATKMDDYFSSRLDWHKNLAGLAQMSSADFDYTMMIKLGGVELDQIKASGETIFFVVKSFHGPTGTIRGDFEFFKTFPETLGLTNACYFELRWRNDHWVIWNKEGLGSRDIKHALLQNALKPMAQQPLAPPKELAQPEALDVRESVTKEPVIELNFPQKAEPVSQPLKEEALAAIESTAPAQHELPHDEPDEVIIFGGINPRLREAIARFEKSPVANSALGYFIRIPFKLYPRLAKSVLDKAIIDEQSELFTMAMLNLSVSLYERRSQTDAPKLVRAVLELVEATQLLSEDYAALAFHILTKLSQNRFVFPENPNIQIYALRGLVMAITEWQQTNQVVANWGDDFKIITTPNPSPIQKRRLLELSRVTSGAKHPIQKGLTTRGLGFGVDPFNTDQIDPDLIAAVTTLAELLVKKIEPIAKKAMPVRQPSPNVAPPVEPKKASTPRPQMVNFPEKIEPVEIVKAPVAARPIAPALPQPKPPAVVQTPKPTPILIKIHPEANPPLKSATVPKPVVQRAPEVKPVAPEQKPLPQVAAPDLMARMSDYESLLRQIFLWNDGAENSFHKRGFVNGEAFELVTYIINNGRDSHSDRYVSFYRDKTTDQITLHIHFIGSAYLLGGAQVSAKWHKNNFARVVQPDVAIIGDRLQNMTEVFVTYLQDKSDIQWISLRGIRNSQGKFNFADETLKQKSQVGLPFSVEILKTVLYERFKFLPLANQRELKVLKPAQRADTLLPPNQATHSAPEISAKPIVTKPAAPPLPPTQLPVAKPVAATPVLALTPADSPLLKPVTVKVIVQKPVVPRAPEVKPAAPPKPVATPSVPKPIAKAVTESKVDTVSSPTRIQVVIAGFERYVNGAKRRLKEKEDQAVLDDFLASDVAKTGFGLAVMKTVSTHLAWMLAQRRSGVESVTDDFAHDLLQTAQWLYQGKEKSLNQEAMKVLAENLILIVTTTQEYFSSALQAINECLPEPAVYKSISALEEYVYRLKAFRGLLIKQATLEDGEDIEGQSAVRLGAVILSTLEEFKNVKGRSAAKHKLMDELGELPFGQVLLAQDWRMQIGIDVWDKPMPVSRP